MCSHVIIGGMNPWEGGVGAETSPYAAHESISIADLLYSMTNVSQFMSIIILIMIALNLLYFYISKCFTVVQFCA